jgi:hypothetical protein
MSAADPTILKTLSAACPLSRWQTIVERTVELAEKGDAKAREWLSTWLLPKPGDAFQLARLDAADRLDFDLSEIHVSEMYHEARMAKSTGQVAANFPATERAGKIKGGSITELLNIALFGPDAGDGNDTASPP